LKYTEYVCVPAAFHLQHPVKAFSSGSSSIGAVPNPVISYDAGCQIRRHCTARVFQG